MKDNKGRFHTHNENKTSLLKGREMTERKETDTVKIYTTWMTLRKLK